MRKNKRMIAMLVGTMVLGGIASTAMAADVLRDDFEAGLGNWTANAGIASGASPATTSAAPDPKGQSFVHKDFEITRIVRGFTLDPNATSVKLSAEFYTNNTSSTQRSYGQLGQHVSGNPSTNGALARIATNNSNPNTYRLLYWNGSALTNVDTNVALSVGWHTMSLTYDLATKDIRWAVDSVSGQVNNSALLAPTAVVLGNNVTNGATGAPDTTTWWDNILVEQFAAAAAPASPGGPSNGATVPPDQDLSWSGSGTSYDVFLGTNAESLARVADNITATTFDPGALSEGTYFWRVDANNAVGDPTLGQVQSFTVVPEPASLSALGLGAMALLGRRRRK